jgi:hypothetical protein
MLKLQAESSCKEIPGKPARVDAIDATAATDATSGSKTAVASTTDKPNGPF